MTRLRIVIDGTKAARFLSSPSVVQDVADGVVSTDDVMRSVLELLEFSLQRVEVPDDGPQCH